MPSEAESLLQLLNSGQGSMLNESQYRILRGKYFTVKHVLIEICGHKIDMINEPRHRNCEYCWWAWLSAHGELVETVDRALREQGETFLIKMRGKHFLTMFRRYMSTVARFQKEAQEQKLQERANEQTGEIQSNCGRGEGTGQAIRLNDIPETGEPSIQGSTVSSDKSGIGG